MISNVDFIFNTINLPTEEDDEAASHGFFAFKIRPSDVIIGYIILGQAKIYFDFNAQIITNTVSTEIVQTLNIQENESIDNLIIYDCFTTFTMTDKKSIPIGMLFLFLQRQVVSVRVLRF